MLVYQLASQFFLVDVGIVEARIINYLTSVKLSKIQGERLSGSSFTLKDAYLTSIQALIVSGPIGGKVSSTRLSFEY